MAQPQPPLKPVKGFVKQVLSGDSLVIRDIPRGARPAEFTVNLAYLIAPKIAKKDGNDEPWAWEAREFLRDRVIGKEVYLSVEYQIPATKRDCGILFLGKDENGENVSEALVEEGLAEVRSSGQKLSEAQQKLKDLEGIARTAGKGKWSSDLPQNHVRDVKNGIENPTNFVDSLKKQPQKAIVEHVRDGSTVRVLLLPDFYNVLVLIAGIKCPSCGPNSPEEGGEEAKYFTEARLLQRMVDVTLLGVSNQNFIGTVQHPNGNIAEFLLSQGFAQCSDYSLKMIPEGREKLRAAEKLARDKRLRIWKNYTPSGVTIEAKDKEFAGKVVEVVNADALVVKTPSGLMKKIFLSSVRPPRLEENKTSETPNDPKGRNFRPLYDIPFMYEAREFLRKKLIGKKVNVNVDYIQPASNSFPEKTCCTVSIGGINVAETLIGKGLAMVVRHKSGDVDQRSSHYDELMAAEMKAQKSGKGMHGKKDNAVHRVVDLSGDLSKSKAFFPFLERAGKMEAVVEFVASGSRLRLYIPKENKLITFLLGGISCPRATRPGPNSTRIEGEPCGEEALLFTKELCLQREVEIQVEAMDKAGNFIGWLWVEGVNLSIALVGEGLASVHFTAERSPYASELRIKQDSAKARKDKIWLNYVEPKADELIENDDADRNVNYKKVVITEIKPDLNFYAQHEEDGPRLEEMQLQMRQELTSNPPLSGAYTPRKGDLCVAKFTDDGLWYRVKIEKVTGSTVQVFYVDFGNREETQVTALAALPTLYHGVPHGAHEYAFACIQLPKDPEIIEEARYVFHHDTNNHSLKLNVEYKLSGVDYVTLVTEDGDDIVKGLINEGLLLVEKKRERRFQKFLKEYINAEDEARKKRLNIWQYGDITDDEAKEFGM